jgi:hypothetical protein
MRTDKASFALATIVAALAGSSPFDNASARDRVVRGGGLAAIVSDAPQGLRAKRRDLEAHSAASRQGNKGYSFGAHPYRRGTKGVRGRR